MDQDLLERDEEILRLKNHNQNLLVKIKKSKDKKQGNTNLEQENRALKEKSTEKEEEISCLRNLNQKLPEQIKILSYLIYSYFIHYSYMDYFVIFQVFWITLV